MIRQILHTSIVVSITLSALPSQAVGQSLLRTTIYRAPSLTAYRPRPQAASYRAPSFTSHRPRAASYAGLDARQTYPDTSLFGGLMGMASPSPGKQLKPIALYNPRTKKVYVPLDYGTGTHQKPPLAWKELAGYPSIEPHVFANPKTVHDIGYYSGQLSDQGPYDQFREFGLWPLEQAHVFSADPTIRQNTRVPMPYDPYPQPIMQPQSRSRLLQFLKGPVRVVQRPVRSMQKRLDRKYGWQNPKYQKIWQKPE